MILQKVDRLSQLQVLPYNLVSMSLTFKILLICVYVGDKWEDPRKVASPSLLIFKISQNFPIFICQFDLWTLKFVFFLLNLESYSDSSTFLLFGAIVLLNGKELFHFLRVKFAFFAIQILTISVLPLFPSLFHISFYHILKILPYVRYRSITWS